MYYMIKPNHMLGYSTVELSNVSNRRAGYEADGFRVATELEFILAKLVSQHNTKHILKIIARYAEEIGEDDESK